MEKSKRLRRSLLTARVQASQKTQQQLMPAALLILCIHFAE
jgi:hypothetical protein